jgi:phosphoserine phosphatase
MTKERLYIVCGRGNDAVGLVGSITAPIGKAGGNIVDLRQDVLHGLFTIHMVVDLSGTELRLGDLAGMVQNIAEDTGLLLTVDKYLPVPRRPDKRNLLLILLGSDRPGIIASVSETLGKYRANIEVAQTIGREGMFLMELLTDVSQCRIPLENLMTSIEQTVSVMNMKTIFQTEDVFNKKKRILLFELTSSLLAPALRAELLQQAGLAPQAVSESYPRDDPRAVLRRALAWLEGFPWEVLSTVVEGVNAHRGTLELLQTLKTMGYRIGLLSHGLSVLTDHLQTKLGLDYAFGVRTRSDDDSRALLGEVADEDWVAVRTDRVVRELAEQEGVAEQDITVISDAGLALAPGIRLDFDLGQLLHLYNERVISDDNLLGLLGSFGVPRD